MHKLSIKNNYDIIKTKNVNKFFIIESFDNIYFDIILFENEDSKFIKTIEAHDDETLNKKAKTLIWEVYFQKEHENDRMHDRITG